MKITVEKSTLNRQPRFQLVREGELICEITSSVIMERQVEENFKMLASYMRQESGYQNLIKDFDKVYTLLVAGKSDEAMEHIEDVFKLNEHWEK